MDIETDPAASAAPEPGPDSGKATAGRRTLRQRLSSPDPDPATAPVPTTPPVETYATGEEPVPPARRQPRQPEEFWRSVAIPSVWAIIIALVVGAGAGLIGAEYARTRPPVYTSEAVVFFDNPAALALNPGSIIPISQVRGKYAGLVQTDLIAIPAGTIAGVPPGVIAGSVHATATPTNLNLILVATGSTPRLAQTLALATAQAMVNYVTNEQKPFPANLRLQATITTNPRLGARTSPTHKKELTTAAAVAIVTVLVVYVIGQIVADQRRLRRRA